MSRYLGVDKLGYVYCIGSKEYCEKYLTQYSEDDIFKRIQLIPFHDKENLYQDYEIIKIRETNVYLTLEEINMLQNDCKEEMNGIKFVEDEIIKLSKRDDVFDDYMVTQFESMRSMLKEAKLQYKNYISKHLFDNLDIESLNMAVRTKRENKGDITVFYEG